MANNMVMLFIELQLEKIGKVSGKMESDPNGWRTNMVIHQDLTKTVSRLRLV